MVDGGFSTYVFRRMSPETDSPMKNLGKDNTWRLWLIRYPPEGESTTETRKEGADLLNKFLADARFSKWPVTRPFRVVDGTDEENFPALDEFFMNQDIEMFLRQDLEEEDLNDEFFDNFTDFARKIWSGNNLTEFAYGIGFPRPELN